MPHRAPTVDLDRIAEEAADLLGRNLDFWFPRGVAERGFHQNMARDGSLLPDETRFLVYQARMLWVAATASEAFPDRRDDFLGIVRHGRRELSQTLLDRANGGHWWITDLAGRPIGKRPELKLAYGLAFALYGLSAAARVCGTADSQTEADAAFAFLERMHDDENGGYFESAMPDGSPLAGFEPEALGPEFGPSGGAARKSQNTHLHLLEALLVYRRVCANPLVPERIEELVKLMTGPMFAAPGVHRAKFHGDWTPIDERWEIGHDLEAAFLLLLASQSDEARRTARSLIKFNLEHGFDVKSGGCFVGGPEPGVLGDRTKVWWVQSEAINGLISSFRSFPDLAYPIAVELDRLWTWFRDRQWDDRFGGFHARLDETGNILGDGAKAEPWKACYHDTRALINLASLRD